MAGNIELQDTLNRKEGPGKISAATPLEARLYGAGGDPLGTQVNPLEVRVRELEAKLTALQDVLTNGTQKTQLTGTDVEIGGVQFRLVNGDRLVGTAAQRPSASAAASALFPGLFYHAYDTGEVSQTTGANWRSLGVA